MECIAQTLDDIEDLCYAFALVWERVRGALRFCLFVAVSLTLQTLGIWLALTAPPLAIATVALLLVWLLYRSAVSPGLTKPQPA